MDPDLGARRGMRRRAISEVAGTMILIGVVVLGMMIVNLVVLSTPTNTRIPALEATMANRSTLITIVHQGGDSIPQGQFRILVNGSDETASFTNSGSYPWSVGQTLSFNASYMPQSAVLIYNGTGTGGVVILETRFPWGVYIAGDQGGAGGGGGSGGGGSGGNTTIIPLPPGSPWFDCSWGYRRNITINHSRVPATQANFPVLISLTADSDLASHAQSGGNDILFTASDGTTKLSHEIESYSGGTLVAWVKIPSLSYTTDTTIMMYYGNSGSASQQDAANVWDANYKGVWHLEEPVADEATSGIHYDSTSIGNNGLQRNNSPIAGQLDGAQNFDGYYDWISVPGSSSLDMTSQLTMEAWVYLTNSNQNQKIMSRADNGATRGYTLGVQTGGLYPEIRDSTGALHDFTSGSVPSNTWTHLAVTWQTGGNFIGYINGVQVNSIAAGGNNIGTTALQDLRMGAEGWSGTPFQWFATGRIDEVRVSATVRSPQWIGTEYNSTSSPSTFSSVGGTVSSPCSVTPAPTTAPWYDCSWGYRRRITIDHTKVTGNQTDFPVLISLATDSGLQGHADAGGDDIFFTAADGTTKLSHEIENYTASTGTLVAWVKVPSLSSVADTIIYLNYGNPTAPNEQNPTGVWDNNFVVVQHMNAASYNTTDDSTANHNDVTSQVGTPLYQQAGQIGYAVNFSGANALEMADSASLDLTSQVTECAWVRLASATTFWNRIVAKSHTLDGPPFTMYGLIFDDENHVRTEITSAGTQYFTNGDTPVSPNTWNYACGSYDHSAIRIYLNGNSDNATPVALAGNIQTNNMPLSLARSGYGSNYFYGRIDEVQVSSVARSAGWIKTAYTNMKNPSTFSSIAGEEISPCTPVPTTPIPPTVIPTPNPPWSQCSWTYRKLINIDHNKVPQDQTNFPVLINLSADPDLVNHARHDGVCDGCDIFFTTTGNPPAQMPYERESYNAGTGALLAWVKVPMVNSTVNTTLYMYYGDPTAPDMSDATDVWTNGYAGVWHFDESYPAGGHGGTYKDSTANGNTAYQFNESMRPGIVGGAQNFTVGNGIRTWIWVNGPSPSLNVTSALTVEAWVNLTNALLNQKVIGREDFGANPTRGYLMGVVGGIYPEVWTTTGGHVQSLNNPTFPSNKWTMLAETWQTNGQLLGYQNGTQITSVAAGANDIGSTSLRNLTFGAAPWDGGASWPMSGLLDEPRISTVVRSPKWIATEYNNTASPSIFSSPGPEEDYVCGGAGPYYVQSRSMHFQNVNTASITLPYSTTAGDLLVLSFVVNTPNGYATIGDSKNGNLAYNIVNITEVGGWGKLYTFYAANSLGGPGPITATVTLNSAAGAVFDLFFLEYGGVATVSPYDGSSWGNATLGTAMNSGARTISTVPELIYGFGADDKNCHAATLYTDRETADGQCAIDQTVYLSGFYNATATQDSAGAWALQMAAFKGA